MTQARNWKTYSEWAAMLLIALGILFIVQGFSIEIYGAGFLILIAGTLIFIVVSHL